MTWTLNATEQQRFWSRQLGSVDLCSPWGLRAWSLRFCFFYLSDWCREKMKVKRVQSGALYKSNRELYEYEIEYEYDFSNPVRVL